MKQCNICYYRSYVGREISTCDYMLITGQRRNSDPENCDKFINKKDKPRRSFKYLNLKEF